MVRPAVGRTGLRRAGVAFAIALAVGAAAFSSSAVASGTPDLQLQMFADFGVVGSGQPLTYTLLVTNLSATDSATNVKVIDSLPAGATFSSATAGCAHSAGVVTCIVATLAASSFRGFEITIAAPVVSGPMPPNPANPPAPIPLPQITNTATVSADEADPNVANNSASLTTLVQPVTDISVTNTGPATAAPGSTISFAIGVTNRGPSDARWVIVYDPVPAGTTAAANAMTSPDSQICGIEVPSQQFPTNPHVGEYGSVDAGACVVAAAARRGNGDLVVSGRARRCAHRRR